jgi:hypothetical protein
MTDRYRFAMRRAAFLAVAALAVPSTACRSARRDPDPDPDHMTSAELVAAGERDTVFVRRVRMFEEIAARIPTDSLARLYVAAIDAPADRARVFQSAFGCQYFRMIWQYGSIASTKAIRRVEDSLFATPAAREPWRAAQRRWPLASGPVNCDASDLRRSPDSLEMVLRRTVEP